MSIAEMKQMARLGKIMGTVFAVFLSTALIAAVIAFIGTQIYNPFQNVDVSTLIAHLPPAPDSHGKSLGEIIVNTFTVPDFLQLFTKSSLLPLIVFSVLLGLATSMSGEKGQPVADFLDLQPDVALMRAHIEQFLTHWLDMLDRNHRSYVTVAIGCTGGQHRSVYLVERLAQAFSDRWTALKRHRELDGR